MTTPDQIQARIDAAKNEAISQVNDKFEALRVDMLKEVKPAYEVGKIYKDPKSKLMMRIVEFIDTMQVRAYGFEEHGTYCKDDGYFSWGCDGCVEATEVEWFEVLKKEAVKRYDKKTVVCLDNNNHKSLIDFSKHSEFKYEPVVYNDCSLFIGMIEFNGDVRACVFDAGIWAEVVTPVKEKPLVDYAYDFGAYCEKHNDTPAQNFLQFFKQNNLKITPND